MTPEQLEAIRAILNDRRLWPRTGAGGWIAHAEDLVEHVDTLQAELDQVRALLKADDEARGWHTVDLSRVTSLETSTTIALDGSHGEADKGVDAYFAQCECGERAQLEVEATEPGVVEGRLPEGWTRNALGASTCPSCAAHLGRTVRTGERALVGFRFEGCNAEALVDFLKATPASLSTNTGTDDLDLDAALLRYFGSARFAPSYLRPFVEAAERRSVTTPGHNPREGA